MARLPETEAAWRARFDASTPAAALVDELHRLYDVRPRPLVKMYGRTPTPEQRETWAALNREYNRAVSYLRRLHKVALARDNAAFHARAKQSTLGAMSKLNSDASAAVAAARTGQCRTAMKHLFDAAPHNQSDICSADSQFARDFKQANVIVAGLCTVDKGRGHKYKSPGFAGARRRRR